jgi:hypothetical protein
MKFELILAVDSGDGQITNVPLAQMTRPDVSELATLGLSLSESKQLLAQLQREIVTRQFEATTQQRRHCGQCGTKRAIKDFHGARFRSLFGDVELRVPRLRRCHCAVDSPVQGSANATLRQRWIAPELEYVQSELAAVLPYARSAQLLSKLLPIGAGNSASTVRARTLHVGQRLESELTAAAPVKPPRSRTPRPHVTTVGLDGGYVRHCDPAAGHSFEIIAGRLLADDGAQSSVGFVRTVDQHSRTRVQRAVAEQGKTSDHLMVFTDGDSRLRDLQLCVLPKATHVLDWYHLTRRLTVLSHVVCSKEAAEQLPPREHARLSKWVGSIKWRLWHGRPVTAIARLESLLSLLGRPSLAGTAVVARTHKLAAGLLQYLKNNAESLPNYGRRYRAGERISTAFVESAVNQIIDKRMSKSQQMRWSPESAHLLLQVRIRVIDGRLRQDFERWYPGFTANDATLQLSA